MYEPDMFRRVKWRLPGEEGWERDGVFHTWTGTSQHAKALIEDDEGMVFPVELFDFIFAEPIIQVDDPDQPF